LTWQPAAFRLFPGAERSDRRKGTTEMRRSTRILQDMKLQRAIRWISEALDETPETNRGEMVDRASQTFGLSPRQEEFLYHMYGVAT
jgi:hypothetical protein